MRLSLRLAVCLLLSFAAWSRPRIDLNGTWQFQLDGTDWRTIQVPGCWQAQGFGQPAGVLRHDYSGVAWYRREVAIPAGWRDKVVELRLGGVLRRVTLFVNDRKVAEHDGMSAPFSVDVTEALHPGQVDTLRLRVENPANPIAVDPRKQTAKEPTGMLNYIGNWGGLYGPVELEAHERTWIEDVAVTPDIEKSEVRFHLWLRSRESGPARVSASVGSASAGGDIRFEGGRAESEIRVPLPGARPWSPEDPYLYTATLRLEANGRERDSRSQRFGMRQASTRGKVLLLNGKPYYLRGFGDDNVEVLSGTPPASKEVHLERLRRARAYGFNAVRFHSMTPMREYFEAADEAGILVMAELPVAYTMYLLPHKDFLRGELREVLSAHRNHPSFLSLAIGGNELDLNWMQDDPGKQAVRQTVEEFYKLAKSIDPNRLILSTDGHILYPTDMVSTGGKAAPDVPTVRHEFGEYFSSLPDPSLIPKFTGVMRPEWLEKKKEWIENSGLAAEYPLYLKNSHRLLELGHRFQIERARVNPDVTGYHYWLITDYPGGTGEGDSWEEGWFDYFWQPKNTTPEEGREINSPVLIMTDAGPGQRTLWNGERKRIQVLVSNYGPEALDNAEIHWTLKGRDGALLGSGLAGRVTAGLGQVVRAAEFELAAPGDGPARQMELELTLQTQRARYANRWSFWSFPRTQLLGQASAPVVGPAEVRRAFPFVQSASSEAGALLISTDFNEDCRRHLQAGGRVWLLSEKPGKATFFQDVGGAQGSLIHPSPALDGFPHGGMLDLQFYNLVQGSSWFALDAWPKELVPIAGGLRTTTTFLSAWKELSRTGFIFEAKVGPGRLLVTSLLLAANLDDRHPEAMYLFDRLLRYALSPEFAPKVTVDAALLR